MKAEYVERLKRRSEKRVLMRNLSDLFVKFNRMDQKMVAHRLHLKQMLGFSEVFVKKSEKCVWKLLGESIGKVKHTLKKKLWKFRTNKRESQNLKKKTQGGEKRKVIYNSRSKTLLEEQM